MGCSQCLDFTKRAVRNKVCEDVISYFGNRLQEVGLLNQRINTDVILIDIIAMSLLSPSNHNSSGREKGNVRKFSCVREILFLIFPTNISLW